jgi:glycosyltransferase involved in cell wall biosynthesis
VLVDAAALLGQGVRVRIVGDGPLRGELVARIEASGAPVELLGSLPPAQVRQALEEADVLAMPCVVARDGDRDSMPVVVKEAMAMQLLVVASDEVGLPECVLAPWGFLAAPGNPRALAQALRRALALGPQERSRAGDQARAWVKRHADVDSQTARMSAVIDRTDESTRDLRWSPHNAVKRGRREN